MINLESHPSVCLRQPAPLRRGAIRTRLFNLYFSIFICMKFLINQNFLTEEESYEKILQSTRKLSGFISKARNSVLNLEGSTVLEDILLIFIVRRKNKITLILITLIYLNDLCFFISRIISNALPCEGELAEGLRGVLLPQEE